MKEILNNGHPIPFENIPENNYEEYAEAFSEENEKLKEILLYCFKNGIKTIGCCAGHIDKKGNKAYICFEYCQENMDIISKLMLLEDSDMQIEMEFSSYNDKKSKPMFWIGCNPEKADKLFECILESCKTKQNIELSPLQKQILVCIDNHSVNNSVFLVKMSKSSRTGMKLYSIISPYQYNGEKIKSKYDYAYTYPNKYLDDRNDIVEAGETIELDAVFEDELKQLLSVILQGQEKYRTQNDIDMSDSKKGESDEYTIDIPDIEQATSNVRLPQVQQEITETNGLAKDILEEEQQQDEIGG